MGVATGCGCKEVYTVHVRKKFHTVARNSDNAV